MRTMLALLAMTVTANAGGDVTFDYESFHMTQTGAAEVVLKFTNTTGADVEYAIADCALLDADGKAVTVIAVATTDIQAGGFAYANNFGPRQAGIKQVACRIR